jgi:PilZ domain-containing protein
VENDKRRQPRSKPTGRTWVCCYNNYPPKGEEQYNLATEVVDFSAGGICVITVGRLRESALVTVELALPKSEARFKTMAVVRWTDAVESAGRVSYVAGLQFNRPLEQTLDPGEVRKSRKPAASSHEEERSYKRFAPEDIEIVCVERGVLKSLGLAPNTGRRLKDLSRSGAQIICSRKLKPGQRVDLRLEFKRGADPIEAEALVRWCEKDTSSSESRYLAGVHFEKLPPGSDRRLLEVERAYLGTEPSPPPA